MSTGTPTILHFTILPVQPIFWHRGASSTGTCAISHFTTLPCQPTFWHRGASFWHVDGHIYYIILYTLLYSPVQPTCWHRGASFWHVDGVILACRRAQVLVLSCRRAHVLFYTLLFSLSNLLILGIAGRHFGMSTGSFWHVKGHIYYFTLYFLPFQPSFWHRGASFWHFDGHTFFFTIYYSPFPDYFLASMRSSLALPHICYAMRCSSGSGLGVGWGVVGCDNVLWL